ncbi:MAG TPA: site-2 protease family protein [Solirubrobacterales bacterium]|jgi:regulator of sigma E protease
MSWLLAFLGFAALIILHEAGHFTAAKAVGMKVEKFYLFFPPKLAAVRRGETEYGIGWIPLGGFVKIAGMNPDEKLPPEDAHRGYYAQPVWKRIVVIAAGPFVNLVIAFAILFALGFSLQEPTSIAVGAVEENAPADGVLEPGDRVIAVNGVRVRDATAEQQREITESFERFSCEGPLTDGCRATEEATITVERDGERRTLEVRPFYDGELGRFRMGIAFELTDLVPVDSSPGDAATWALDRMWFVTERTAEVFVNILDPETREQISGVVGSYEVTRQSFEFDTRQALGVLALISLSLAIINLFPFLPLDGGHIFWSVIEKVRRRPVSFQTMERASVVGFALVVMLFLIGLTNDIDRLTGEGFSVR